MSELTSNSKTNFYKGLVTGLLVMVVLGGVYLAGQRAASKTGYDDSKSGSPTVVAGQPSPTGEIQLAEVTNKDWVRGDRDAKISIVEYSDLECPFCKRFHPTMQQVMAEYGDQVNWVYRHFPLTSLHPKAAKEAEATECAGELGGNDAFWKYTDRLFEITPSNNGLQLAQLGDIADYVGLDRTKFQTCLDSGKYASKVQEQAQQAQAAGGRGTPYSIIVTEDGQKIPINGALPFAQVQAMIDSVL